MQQNVRPSCLTLTLLLRPLLTLSEMKNTNVVHAIEEGLKFRSSSREQVQIGGCRSGLCANWHQRNAV